jgi:uncharacterized repeat protein (TIGR01451 family)
MKQQKQKNNTMKTKLLALLASAWMLMMCTTSAKAQTTVTIGWASDSSWMNNCPLPATIDFMLSGSATGYNYLTDSIDVQVFFGDGNDTTFTVPIGSTDYFWGYIQHTYTTAGLFSVDYIATGVDGNDDTLTNYNEVVIAQTCGNINGKIYLDMNSNCSYDAGTDTLLRGYPVELKFGSSVIGWGYSDNNGDYYLSAPTGNYTVELYNPNSFGLVPTCPASGSIAVNTSSNPTNDFGLTCSSGFDLEAYLWGWGFKPGFPAYLYPQAWNSSCMPQSGTLTLTLDPLVTFDSSSVVPASINGNVITWNFSGINNQYWWWWWSNFWNTTYLTTSPNAQIGDTVCFTVTVTPTTGDINPSNNTFTFCRDVRNSWDPNAKEVSPQGLGATGRIAPDKELTYTIHFQNTGNDVAQNVAIIDTLDADLDLSTFEVLSSSHTMYPEIYPGNIVKFNFNNIMLADSGTSQMGSQGSITYKIHTRPNLQNGTQIKNTGYIYFDFNPAIITNTTLNTIDIALGVKELKNDNTFEFFPNPANDLVTINFSESFKGEISMVDVLGNVVMKGSVNGMNVNMNIQGLTPGVYTIVLNSDNVSTGKKVIVIH